jgi:6-hydroxycyclohex-1-ene-1-carbonyl-CoA dehydrogenase
VKVESTDLELVGIAVEAIQSSGVAAGAMVGRVEDASEGSASLIGKRVLIGPLDPCGQCEICRRGGAAVCPHAKRHDTGARIRVSARFAVPLGDGLDLASPAAAAVPGDVTTAYTLYARTGLAPREPVVLLGTTPVTRFLVAILRGKGITPTVITTQGTNAWRDWLASTGSAIVDADGADDAIAAAVTAAIAAQGQGARPWRIIVTDATALPLAVSLAGPRATLTVLASGAQLASIPGDVLSREVTVIGVAGPHPDLIVEAAALCVKGEIDLAAGVTTTPGDVTRTHVTAL